MIRVVGVQFQQEGKMLFYNAGELDLHAGDYIVAETAHGPDLGEVLTGITEKETEGSESVPRVIRKAAQQDIQQAADNRIREKEAYQICQKKIAEHKLEMKLVSVECTFDNSKMMFYFTANGRIDFRALVKDLASTFKTRIELRQIGVRDEARMLGGLGPCGRPICCGAFLTDFQPVSIKMAKEQSLSLNPTKISGVCGRLMCCLKYEQDQYEQTRKKMPRVGREVITPDGPGTVCDLNIVKETVSVRIPSGDTNEIRTYPLTQISKPGSEPVSDPQPTEMPESGNPPVDEERTEAGGGNSAAETAADGSAEGTNQPARPRRNRRDKNSLRPAQQQNRAEGDSGKDRQKSPEKTRGQNNRPRAAGAKETGNNETKFGQPVRRENPEKDKNQAGGKAEKTEKRGADNSRQPSPDKNSGRGARNGGKSTKWADALEKAIQAADHE